MSKINIFVVEDESIISKDIQNTLKHLGYNVIGSADTGEEAIEKVKMLKPDLVLMDIMLKGKLTGIEATDHIKNALDIPVIYLTAFADEATLTKAKITEPYGYILKPFEEIDLHTSIEMAIFKHQKELERKKERNLLYSIVESKENSNSIFVKSKSKLVKVNTVDLLFVEALKDYVVINTSTVRYTIHSTMKDIDTKLPEQEYVRVHRSFIVRLDKIKSIESNSLTLEGVPKPIPIGGSYKDILNSRINTI